MRSVQKSVRCLLSLENLGFAIILLPKVLWIHFKEQIVKSHIHPLIENSASISMSMERTQRKITILIAVKCRNEAMLWTYTKNVITNEAMLRGDFRYMSLLDTPVANLNITY